MYGLKQAAIIDYNQIILHMKPHGYYPVPFTPGIWAHKTRKINFCLCVDDFGVKYFSKDDANNLLNSLLKHYAISTDSEGRNYIGLRVDWNYSEEYVAISMPDYVRKALDRLKHPKTKIPQYAPHLWSVPVYVKILQMTPDPDKSNIFDKKATNRIQYIVGTMLYYAW